MAKMNPKLKKRGGTAKIGKRGNDGEGKRCTGRAPIEPCAQNWKFMARFGQFSAILGPAILFLGPFSVPNFATNGFRMRGDFGHR